MSVPIVLTYTYLGKDLGGPSESGQPEYYFRYLPAIQYDRDETNASERSGSTDLQTHASNFDWEHEFPALFSGWGEKYPTVFSEDQVTSFHTIAGLIDELSEVRTRRN